MKVGHGRWQIVTLTSPQAGSGHTPKGWSDMRVLRLSLPAAIVLLGLGVLPAYADGDDPAHTDIAGSVQRASEAPSAPTKSLTLKRTDSSSTDDETLVAAAVAVAVDDDYVVDKDSEGVLDPSIQANDTVPPGAVLQFATQPEHGTLTANGSIYRPDDGFVGTDSFTYSWLYLDGGSLATSNVATVTITVKEAISPIAVDDAYTVPADEPTLLTPDVAANDVDSPLGTIGHAVKTQPQHGTIAASTPDGHDFTYTPEPGFVGTDSFQYSFTYLTEGIDFPLPFESNTATVTLTVVADEQPTGLVANDDVYELEEDSVSVTLEPPPTDNDTGTIDAAVLETQPAHGSLNQTSATTFQYTPDPGFDGEDSFTYRAEGPGNDPSNIATVTLSVTPLDEGDGGGGDGTDDDDDDSRDDDDDDGASGAKLPDTGGTLNSRLLFLAMLSSMGGLLVLANTRRRNVAEEW